MLVPPPPSGGAAVLAGFQMIAAFQVGRPDLALASGLSSGTYHAAG